MNSVASILVPRSDAPRMDASAGALGRTLHPLPSTDAAFASWDCLFTAVAERLRYTVGERFAATHNGELHDLTTLVTTQVLECAEALEQLHAMVATDSARRQVIEREVIDLKTALADAHAELAESHARENRARHRAVHDGLTTLPNRSFFRSRLDDALAQAVTHRKSLAVLYLDLDGFKPINDAQGHDAGDELLSIIAARLKEAVRADDMVGRMGGDEFACLLIDLPGREPVGLLARKLLDTVSAPLPMGQLKLTVRPSIGVAMYPTDGASSEALLKNADAAMYRAKRQKTGYAFFGEFAEMWLQKTV